MAAQRTDRQVFEAFRSRRKRQLFVVAPVLIVIGLLIWVEQRPDGSLGDISPTMLLGGLFVVVIGVVIFSFMNWRCPGCRGYLGKGISPKFCPRCGIKLQEA
jgi:hypothetical protein